MQHRLNPKIQYLLMALNREIGAALFS
jgi:hypothetical protein